MIGSDSPIDDVFYLRTQIRDIVQDDIPDDINVNTEIIMDEFVSYAGNVFPGGYQNIATLLLLEAV